MTSGPRDRADAGREGFTFFELMLVLAIVAVVFIASVPLIGPGLRERKLRAVAQDIQGLLRAERSEAQASGDRRVLEVRPLGFFEKDRAHRQVLAMPKDARVTLRPIAGKWEKPLGQEWEFSPIGMVTPFSVRVEDGDSWMEFDVDLLTGRVAEERYAF